MLDASLLVLLQTACYRLQLNLSNFVPVGPLNPVRNVDWAVAPVAVVVGLLDEPLPGSTT